MIYSEFILDYTMIILYECRFIISIFLISLEYDFIAK